ncbi:MAG TPA: tRNA-uridine aminocarboxypropyltransferase, partial [Kofleriaceae bacterium]|nr:tRNA-uridine aminocarboxypropyltransferase [Kofleriaceae bacterium]
LCLPEASLHVGVRWDGHAALGALLADPSRPPILLYPSGDAVDILRAPPPGPVTLVVVDGTWSQAKSVVRDNAVLRALPRYAFAAPEPSQYRIRREPHEEYVSTIEALMYVLGALEGDAPRFRALLAPLGAMVDAQLAANRHTPRFRHRRRVPGPSGPRIPPVVRERYGSLVCVVGESNAWPFRDGAQQHPEELVHWMAERVATGERLSVMAAPRWPLSPSTSFHTGLTEATLLGAGDGASLVAGAQAFLRPDDVLCAWGHHSANLLAKAGATLPRERLDLRAALQRLRNAKLGTLEDVGESLAAEASPAPGSETAGAAPAGSAPAGSAPAGPGRAGRRLAILTALVRAWYRQEQG